MPRDREAVRPQDPQLRGQYQVFRRQDYVRTYARTCTQWVYFNIIMYYTLQRSSTSRDRHENNLRQDGEGEKRTTPTSQAHVPGSTNILDVPTECYIVT